MANSVVAPAVARSLADLLRDLLKDEIISLLGVRQNVDDTQIKLMLIRRALEDADKKQSWVSELREIVYDTEDVIRTFSIKTGISNPVKRYAWYLGHLPYLHKVGSDITAIKTRISSLVEFSNMIPVREHSSSSAIDLMQYPHVNEDIVGLKRNIEELVKSLKNDCKHGTVVSIWGMAGMGKTTLAKQLYHNIDIRRHFDCFGWAYISQQCNQEDAWKEILYDLVSPSKEEKENIKELSKKDLANELYQVQMKKKCLVILDDIWNATDWKNLCHAFPPNGKGRSKILLTTRNKELASSAGGPHELKFLTVEEGWELFRMKAFPGVNNNPEDVEANPMEKEALSRTELIPEAMNEEPSLNPEFQKNMNLVTSNDLEEELQFVHQSNSIEGITVHEDVEANPMEKEALSRTELIPEAHADFESKERLGREIVVKCGGLPLAIVVLGGLFANKEVREWERMYEDVLRQPMGHEQQLSEVLALSYNELPYELKPCFLYLSHFPEDAAIPRKKLIQLWIAEGIVSQDNSKQVLEDVAEKNLVCLINRCMVQVGDFGSTERIKTCRLHDMMREFCLDRAEKENFLKRIDYPNESEPNECDDASSQRKTRRLAINLPEDVDRLILSQRKEYSNLRSLLYFHGKTCRVKDWPLIEKTLNLEMLRVLDLEGVKGPFRGELPREIGHLIQLQYLSLKKTEIGVLPSSIGNLIFLKTLNLQTIGKFSRDSTVQIPNVIWKMKRLTHLYLPKWCGNMVDKLRLSNLNRLQTLVNFPANKCDVKDLLKLTNLRKLVLNDPGHFKSLVEIFNPPKDTLSCLQSLSLKSETLQFPDEVVDVRQLLSGCSGLQKLHVEGRIEKLPERLQLPQKLAKLTLWGSNLVEDPIPTLEELPNLIFLSGWNMFVGKKMVFSNRGFRKLRTLLLRGLPDFEDWIMEEGAMPRLYRLEISNCNKLKTIPDAVSSVRTLQELEICGCLFKIKIEPEGEDYNKVRHVPSIVIRN